LTSYGFFNKKKLQMKTTITNCFKIKIYSFYILKLLLECISIYELGLRYVLSENIDVINKYYNIENVRLSLNIDMRLKYKIKIPQLRL